MVELLFMFADKCLYVNRSQSNKAIDSTQYGFILRSLYERFEVSEFSMKGNLPEKFSFVSRLMKVFGTTQGLVNYVRIFISG